MIWGCFIGNKLGPIVFIDGTVNKEVYVGMLEEFFLPFLDAVYTDKPTLREFQQDNARPHVAKITRDWFKCLAEKYDLKLMQWLPNSSDMNPIEHLWERLKRELHQRYPDTFSLKGSPESIKATLCQRLYEVWWDIGEDILNHLVESMPRRVKALLKAGGWYTEF
jgi:DDE superfamily endonuclease